MPIKAYCQAVAASGSLVKVLLTWQESPSHPQETALLNVLNDRWDFAQGKVYRITIEEEGD